MSSSAPNTLFCAPHPDLPGGVNAAVSALLSALPEARRLTVGRHPRLPLAAALDPFRLRRQQADVVVLNTSLRAKALARDLTLLAAWGRPAALWIHGGTDRTWATLPRALATSLADRALLVVLAERFRERLLALGVPDERIAVIPPCYDPARIPERTGQGRDLLALGRLSRAKGADVLVEAFARVAGDHPEVRLVLAGVGDLEAWLRTRTHTLRLRSRVDFPGQLGPAQARAALGRAAVLVQASREEAVPVAVLEGLATGLPVVATPVGAVSETVGPAGRIVPVGDVAALAEALDAMLLGPTDPELSRARALLYHPVRISGLWRAALAQALA